MRWFLKQKNIMEENGIKEVKSRINKEETWINDVGNGTEKITYKREESEKDVEVIIKKILMKNNR